MPPYYLNGRNYFLSLLKKTEDLNLSLSLTPLPPRITTSCYIQQDTESLCSIADTVTKTCKCQKACVNKLQFWNIWRFLVSLHAIRIYRWMEEYLHSFLYSTSDGVGSQPHASAPYTSIAVFRPSADGLRGTVGTKPGVDLWKAAQLLAPGVNRNVTCSVT